MERTQEIHISFAIVFLYVRIRTCVTLATFQLTARMSLSDHMFLPLADAAASAAAATEGGK